MMQRGAHEMRVIIDGWAWLERGALSEGNLRALRTALTVQPILTTDVAGVAQPKSIMLYRDRPEEGLFGVPRGFYRASAKGQNEEVVRVSRGSAMQPMTSCYRADGPFAQQAEALAVLQHQLMSNSWGGGILCAGCGSGKALAHGEPVLLRRGWTSIEEVRVGDEAAGTDGGFHRVTGVFPQGERDLFRVAFSDGTHVDCDGDHLWTLVKRRKRDAPTVTISTHDLARETLRTSVGRLLWLPTMAPLEGVDGEMVFEPYTLGVLIGDGHFCNTNGISVCTPDREIIDMMTVEPPNRVMALKQRAGYTAVYRFSPPIKLGQQEGSFRKRMRKLGMLGLTAHDKFIPTVYEGGSVATRVSLLQGLFDTDGYASGGGSVEYATVSDQIAHAVQRIVFSLGGTCKLVKRQTRYTKDGVHSRWFDSFRLHIKLPADICPFRFSRKKAEFYRNGWQRKVGRAVESVTAIGKGLATCISVDAPNHLYLTRNCVPTHNTILAVELARRLERATLVVVHKEFFLEQWAARIRDVLPDARIGVVRQDTCDYRDKDFVIAMIQSLAKDVQTQRYPRALYEAFGLFVSDECFPAEQKIDTPDGKVAIGAVVIGMTVFNALGEGVVEHVFKRSVCVSDCVVISLLCGVDIVCTKNHPFLTVDGWKHASSLCGDVLVSFDDCTRMRMEHGEGSQEHTGNMCVLREGEQRQEGTEVLLDDMFGTGDTTEDYEWSSFLRFLWREQTDGEAKKVLFGVLSAESTQSLHAGSFDGVFLNDARKTCEGFFAEGKRFAPYARQEPYAHAWRDRKGYGDQTEEWVCAVKKTRGEWMRHACSTACVTRSAGRWMDRGVRCSDITAEEQSIQVAELLQDRRRTSDDEASDRGGWVFSLSKDEGPRCEEGSFFEGERVVGVAVAQREDFERLGFRTDGDCVDVFNLSVSGHPSYVLDGGIVVHNCHHIGSEVWSSVAHRFTAAYRLGLSATPRRADRAEPVFFHHIGPILHTMQAQSMPFGVRLLQSDSDLTGIRRGDYRVSAMRMNSAQVISQLGEDAARTRHIAEDIAIAVRKGRKVMVVSHRLEHLRVFRADLRKILEVAPPPFPVAIAPYTGQWFTGEEGEAKRTLTREALREAERANVLLCTIQLVAEGLDVSALDVIVLATPLGDAEQAIGRVRRWCTPAPEKCAHYCPWRAGQCTGKPQPVVVDVRDPEVAWSERKARGRDKLYRRMGVALPGEEAQGFLAVDKPPVVG
jgi:hypothetical protein